MHRPMSLYQRHEISTTNFNQKMIRILVLLAIIFPVIQYMCYHILSLNDPHSTHAWSLSSLSSNVHAFNTADVIKTQQQPNIVYDDSFLTMYGEHRVPDAMDQLPIWLKEYIAWHKIQTQTRSNNTKYVVIFCPKDFCGGLSDRMRPIPFFLLFASMVSRVFCIYYEQPQTLENFLEPPSNGIDWRCPAEVGSLITKQQEIDSKRTKHRKNRKKQEQPFPIYNIDRCDKENKIIPCVESKIKWIKENEDRQFLGIQLLSNDVTSINNSLYLFQRQSYINKMPSIDRWDFAVSMNHIFRVMFKPVRPLAIRVNNTMAALGLKENQYSSVHTRCRYPVYPVVRDQGKQVDKGGGMKFEGKTKDLLIEIMNNAIKCAYQLDQTHPIYFASDHDDATEYMITHDTTVDKNGGIKVRPIGVKRDAEPLHLGNLETASQHKVEEFYSIFEDLLIMGGGTCVSHGVGSFGSFAAALTGTNCRAIHRKFTGGLVTCPNDRGDRRLVNITEPVLFGISSGDLVSSLKDIKYQH